MLHRTAKLTPFGRRLLVDRVLIEGWPAATAAEMLGVSRATAYKWLRRYRAEGAAGLEDRSARPHRRPRALAEREVRRILVVRRRLRVGPHRLGPLLGHSRSTVYGVLRRHGVSRLAHADRLTGGPGPLCAGATGRAAPRRRQASWPGAAGRRPPDPRRECPQPASRSGTTTSTWRSTTPVGLPTSRSGPTSRPAARSASSRRPSRSSPTTGSGSSG